MGPTRVARRLAAVLPLCVLIGRAVSGDVSDLVADVSQTRIEAHVAAVEGVRSSAQQMAEAAAYIAAQLEESGYTVESDPIGVSENLIAELPGTTSPDSIFIIGAHFDTVSSSPGADDNGTGIAGMLEAARVLGAARYESSLHFVAFALEESGLQGSSQLAAAYQAAGRNVIGMLSLEMIGYTCPAPCQTPFVDALPCFDVGVPGVTEGNYIAAVANQASATMLSDFLAAAAAYVPGLPTNTGEVAGTGTCFPDSRRSDHAPFWDVGFPAMMLTDTANFRNPNYHQFSDTLATLDLPFTTDVTRTVVGQAATRAVFVPEPGAVPLQLVAVVVLLALRVTRISSPTPRSSADGHA